MFDDATSIATENLLDIPEEYQPTTRRKVRGDHTVVDNIVSTWLQLIKVRHQSRASVSL
jgi:hypothetical protein